MSNNFLFPTRELFRIFNRFLISVYILIFFELGYFWAGRGHSLSSAMDWSFFLDQAIPLLPVFIIFYFLGYLFVFVPSFTLKNTHKFRAAATVFVLIMAISFIIFKLMPIYFEKPRPTGHDFFSRLVLFQQKMDSRYNHFPSLHVSLNVYSLLVIAHYHGKKIAFILSPLVLAIVASTMLVKQHLIIDVAGGILVGYIGYRLYKTLSIKSRLIVNSSFVSALVLMTAFAVYQSHKLEKITETLQAYLSALFS